MSFDAQAPLSGYRVACGSCHTENPRVAAPLLGLIQSRDGWVIGVAKRARAHRIPVGQQVQVRDTRRSIFFDFALHDRRARELRCSRCGKAKTLHPGREARRRELDPTGTGVVYF